MKRLAARFARLMRRMSVFPAPTRLGWYFVGCSILMFLAGCYYRENSFVLLSCVPMALVLVNAVGGWLNLRRLEFKRRLPPDTHAGEPVEIALLVHNAGRGASFALELDDTHLPDLYREEPEQVLMQVSGGHVQRLSYTAVFGRRGVHHLRDLDVSSAFPFGLVRRSRALSFRSEILVYPRPARLSPEFERELLAAARFFGESSVASRGQEEVFGVREYLPGQNVARIHWPTTARLGKPMILELEGRQDASFVLLLDTSPVGDPATLRQRLESAVGLMAGLTYFLTRQGVLFRFGWHGDALHASQAGRGDRHYHAVMERLALAGFAEKQFSEWVGEVGVGALGEVPVLVTLGTREHAEAALPVAAGAIVVGAADPDFRRRLRMDVLGRRTMGSGELHPEAPRG